MERGIKVLRVCGRAAVGAALLARGTSAGAPPPELPGPPATLPLRGGRPAGRGERRLPGLQEVLGPAAGPPAENRKITREQGEGLWVLWNEEQDYVAYGGKAPQR